MPMILAAVIGAVVTAAVTAIPAIAALGVIGTIIGGLAGLLVSAGVNFAFRAFTKTKAKPNSTTKAAAQDSKVMVRSSAEPRRVVYGQQRVSGPIAYVASSGDLSQYLHLVVLLAGHPVSSISTVWLNDEPIELADMVGAVVKNGKFLDKVWIQRHTGASGDTAEPILVQQSPDGWDGTHLLRGIAYVYLRLEYDRELFQGGVPNVSALVTGKNDIGDPRTGLSGYTNNWALCIRDYLLGAHGLACDATEIDDASFIAAANLADEAVQIDATGTTQPRYTLNGTFTLDRSPIDVMDEMIDAGGGALVYVAGKYRLYGGAYTAPSASLGVSDFAGPLRVVTRASRRDLFNSVRGTFIDPARFWQASGFAPVSSASAVTADGEVIWRDSEMPFITDHVRTQRLALQMILRHRASLTIEAPLRYAGVAFAVWDMVAVTHPDFGWTSKPFRIVGWEFNPAEGSVNVTLQEEQAGSYAWLYDQAGLPPAVPRTTLASPFDIGAPSGLGVTEDLYATRDNTGLRAKASLTWLPVASPFVTGFEVQYRASGAAQWLGTSATQDTKAEVLDLAPGLYEFRVRALTGLSAGDWATVTQAVGTLLAAAPSALANVALQSIGGFAFLSWTRAADIDVRVGGRIEVRHTPATASPTWAGATSIGQAVPGDATLAVVPLKAGTYFVRPVDATGTYGPVTQIAADQATALTFANVTSLTEHSAFSGTKVGVVAGGGVLKLDANGTWDSLASVDGLTGTTVDRLGGIKTSGTYSFSGGFNFGLVKNVRLTSRMLAQVVDEAATWDARAGTVDTWSSIDGVFGGEADAWVEVRTTTDNPAGTPTWTAWRRLDAAEFRCWGAQLRAQLVSSRPSFNINVTELSVSADEVV